ncbi:MAG: hypothetical protein KJO54_12795 [Gammaproteobacteria bacterium]|nr:hypothetical protein [Gammaproteobacteria bacterium]NNF61879.1 hypothetical protein [Gammaproteobacteria bacterium]NNM19653.1 hypothetical protein [Gammaproteobacteria bacterium]
MPISRLFRTFVLFPFFALAAFPAFADIDLVNDAGFTYDINENEGGLDDGRWTDGVDSLSDACDDCWDMRIDGTRYDPPGTPEFDESGREITFPVQSMSGLDVVRRVFVPQEVNFVRYINTLTNPGTEAITVAVSNETDLGSDSRTTIVTSSSGDALATTEDSWIVTNGDTNDPIVTHVWDGTGGADTADVVSVPLGGNDDVDWTWDSVTVQPGETITYMTLGAMDVTAEDATTSANALANLDYPQIYLGLGAVLGQIQNWNFADDDEDGLPNVYETLFGLDPNNMADAAGDLDGDGLTNLEEYNLGTDPTETDTDGDTLGDGDEVALGTNPAKSDTDGDGVSDSGEVNSGLDPLVANAGLAPLLLSEGLDNAQIPEVWEDAAGKLHIVYTARELSPERGGSGEEVYYTLLDSNGSMLIAPTQVSATGVGGPGTGQNVRAQVAATDAGVVYVVWQENGSSVPKLHLKVLDITADDQDGSAADLMVIGPIAERPLNSSLFLAHSAMTLDADGNAHIMAGERCNGTRTISYFKVGPDGADIFPEVSVINDLDSCHPTIGLGVDSAGDVHYVYSSDYDDFPVRFRLYYGMLSGADGSTLIAPTPVTPEGSLSGAKHSTLSVDANDIVHIVFGFGDDTPPETRGGSNYRSFAAITYMALDPSLDDQSGDAASAEAITATPITMLTEPDGSHPWYVESRMSATPGVIDITWNEGGGYGSAPVYFMSYDTSTGTASEPILVSETAESRTGNNYVPLDGGRALLQERADHEEATGVRSIVAKRVSAAPVQTATDTGIATIGAAGGVAFFLEALGVDQLPASAQPGVPAGVDFIDGFFRAIINGVETGGATTLTLTLPSEYDPAMDFLFVWNAADGWVSLPFTLGGTPNEVIIMLEDGNPGDADFAANGQIVVPLGLAKNSNISAPAFTSSPPAADAIVGQPFSFTITTTDADGGSISFEALMLPSWLTLTDNGDGTATISGTPGEGDIGSNQVSVQAADNGFVPQQSVQSFAITVDPGTVVTNLVGDGGGNGATAPWLLIFASWLWFMRGRRIQKGA